MRMTLTALLAGCIIATAAPAQEQGEPMKDAKTTQTLCLGRFLVDVPKHVNIIGQSSDYRSRSISAQKMGWEAFEKMLLDKENYLKSTKHDKEPSLLRQLVKAGGGDSATFVYRESPIDAYQYKVQAYKWLNQTMFTLDSRADDDRVNRALDLSAKTLSELQFRRNDEIPAVPGFCVNYGFFSGEPGAPHFERASIYFQLKSHPDVRVEVYTQTNGAEIDEGLLARIDSKLQQSEVLELAKHFKNLRRGKHPVGNIEAEEYLQTVPTGETFSTHFFDWEARGKPHDIYAPVISVEMRTGKPTLEGYSRPSVTDKQAIELFDSIVNSIRIRPAGTPAVQKPGKQSKAPLGTSLMSGETCSQSGEWECYHEQAEGERLRFFAEGDVLPEVLLPVPLTPWQKLRGEPASRPFQTHWVLRRLPDNES